MALKPCRECKQNVSTTAKTCPHCGTAHPANTIAMLGGGMQACGCILTLLVTIPLLILFLLLF